MDGSELLERVREETATPLDRLGSERALVAATAASIDRETVLEAARDAEASAAATMDAWAADEVDDEARAAFERAADRERAHRERVAELLADGADGSGNGAGQDPDPDALHVHLRGLAATVDRVGAGLVGRPLVASRTLLQVINFFVNEGESEAADLFRDLRAETDEQATAGAELAVRVADDEEGRRRVVAAAERAIDVAYGEYADRLSAMGVDPKPVC